LAASLQTVKGVEETKRMKLKIANATIYAVRDVKEVNCIKFLSLKLANK